MKISIFLVASLLFFSCKKPDESVVKLLRSEATDYNGILLVTEYEYDSDDRIVVIKQLENRVTPAATFTFTYNGNEITMRNNPKGDPFYNITNEVHLTLDANGKLLKRIGYTYSVGASPYDSSRREFFYDTLVNSFDAAGFLKETKRSVYDSTWAGTGSIAVHKGNATISYTTVAGNVTARDEYHIYTRHSINAGNSYQSGGTFEQHAIYSYTKAYPNKTDFKNAAVLNEVESDFRRTLLDEEYRNMPEQVVTHSIEKDINGTVSFDYTGTTDMERTYNDDNGWLSGIDVLTPTTQYRKIRYFYGR